MKDRLDKLYDKIYQDNSTKEPSNFFKIIESEIDVLDHDYSDNYNSFQKVTRLISDYAIMLSNAGYLKKSLKYFDTAINNIQNDKNISKEKLPNEPLFEALLFHRGMTNYNLNNYRSSRPDFKFLVDNYPENDKYKNWHNGSIKVIYKNILWTLFSIVILSALGSFYFKREDGIVDKIVFLILVISLVSYTIIHYNMKRQLVK